MTRGWLGCAVMVLAAAVANAAPVSFAGSGGQITLTSGGDAQWTIVGTFGTSDGTLGGTCTTGTGLAVADGSFGGKSNAFDNGLTVWINGVLFTTTDSVDVTDGTLTAGPTAIGDLQVTVRHTALPTGPILRTLITVHNPTAAPVEGGIAVLTNLGSDADTAVRASSDGEGLWEVTSDDAVTPTGAVVLTVANGWWGPNGFGLAFGAFNKLNDPPFTCSGDEGTWLSSGETLPPGGTVHYMLFTQLDDDNLGAITAGGDAFEGALAPALLAGLDDDTRLRIVNFYLPGEVELVGGGPGAGSRWYVHNQTQPTNGLPTGGECSGGVGLSLYDAVLDPNGADQRDAFDNGAMLFVDGTVFAASLHPTVTASSYTDGPFPLAGLDTTVTYTALPGSATLRTYATFTNPGSAPITATVTIATNMGSDAYTGVRASSSGDQTFDVADRWVVTSDDAVDVADPVITHVLAGPGSIPVAPSLVSSDVFDCSTTKGILAEFPITVPPGATRAVLFFDGLDQTNDAGITNAARFDTLPATGDELVSDITTRALADVVNWGFCAADATICDDGDVCTVDACGAGGGCSNSALPATPAFLSVGCRLGTLLAAVQGLPAGTLRDALAAKAAVAQAAARAAEGLAGGSKKGPYKKQLRKAGKALKALEKRLRSKPARKALDQATRDALTAQSTALRTDLKTLGTS